MTRTGTGGPPRNTPEYRPWSATARGSSSTAALSERGRIHRGCTGSECTTMDSPHPPGRIPGGSRSSIPRERGRPSIWRGPLPPPARLAGWSGVRRCPTDGHQSPPGVNPRAAQESMGVHQNQLRSPPPPPCTSLAQGGHHPPPTFVPPGRQEGGTKASMAGEAEKVMFPRGPVPRRRRTPSHIQAHPVGGAGKGKGKGGTSPTRRPLSAPWTTLSVTAPPAPGPGGSRGGDGEGHGAHWGPVRNMVQELVVVDPPHGTPPLGRLLARGGPPPGNRRVRSAMSTGSWSSTSPDRPRRGVPWRQHSGHVQEIRTMGPCRTPGALAEPKSLPGRAASGGRPGGCVPAAGGTPSPGRVSQPLPSHRLVPLLPQAIPAAPS